MPAPAVFDDLPSDLQSSDYSLISPDVIRTIIGEGDPAHVASVLANRKAKSGQSYEQLITDPKQFEARTGDAWSSNSKIAEDDPRYQKALEIAGPILMGEVRPVTTADSFYSPTGQEAKGRTKPEWDDGKGVKGPDGQLYFNDKYSYNKNAPAVFDDFKPSDVKINPDEASQLAVDLEASKDNPNWPVYDSYNKVGRNPDGSIAYVGSPSKEDETSDDGTPIVNVTSSSDPAAIAKYLKEHPTDIANKGSAVLAPADNGNGDLLAGGFKQGAANVKNSIEGGLNAVIPGHPFNNDLARQLLNRNNNDVTNHGDTAYGLGKFAGESAATAPILAVPGLDAVEGGGALAQGARFLGGAGGEGNALLRGASLASKGAMQGAETSALTSAGSNEGFGQQVQSGAITGGVAAPVLHGMGAAPKALQGLIQGPPVNPEVIDLADKAINKFGITDLRPDQIKAAPSPVFGVTDTKAGARDATLLQSGTKGHVDSNRNQQTQIFQAVGKTIGLTPEESKNGINEDVIDLAKQRTGEALNQFTKGKVVNGEGWNNLRAHLDRIANDAEEVIGADDIRPVLKQIKRIKEMGDDGGFSGDNYKGRLAKGSSFYNLQKSDNSAVRHYTNQIKDALDDAFEATHNSNEPDFQWGNLQDKLDRDKFRADRLQYKKIMTVEPIANRFGMSGTQLLKSLPNDAPEDLGDLKKIGTAFYSHLDNGTPPRSSVAHDLANHAFWPLVASGEAVAMITHPQLAVPALGLGALAVAGKYGANSAKSSIYNNVELRNRILQGATPQAPNNNYFANKFAVPATVLATRQGN
jgi:hypothetical protein